MTFERIFMIIHFKSATQTMQTPKCTSCQLQMRLVGIEPHPFVSSVDLMTLECICGEVTTELQLCARDQTGPLTPRTQ